MENIIILLLALGLLVYFIKSILKNRKHLMKYLSTVGGTKPSESNPNPVFWIPFLIVHGILGIFIGYLVYRRASDGNMIFRLLLSVIVTMFVLSLLYAFYFMVLVIIKEIMYTRDVMINLILVYSIVTSSILFWQISYKSIEYPMGFLWISAVLYIANIFSIGRIIWTIFKKKILVKSIWSIAFINTSFAIIALSNLAFVVQRVYPVPCYSRTINSWGDSLYFVVITFFTVGYGDLYPVCETTKILTMIIILSGFTFTAVFVSAALSATIEHFGNMDKK